MAGSFKDRRASVSIHVAREKGYAGVIAATSGNYGAAVSSQAARASLKCIIVQEAFDSRHVGQPEIVEKSRICEALGAEVVKLTVGPELFFHMLDLLDETGYFAASLYSSFGVSGIETLGLEIADEMRALHRCATRLLRHHARGRRQHDRHRARASSARARPSTQIVSASVDLSGLHMASDTDFNRKSFTTGPHGLRGAVRDVARPRRRAAQRRALAALHGPLPHRHAGRGLLRHRGDAPSSRDSSAGRPATPRWPPRSRSHARFRATRRSSCRRPSTPAPASTTGRSSTSRASRASRCARATRPTTCPARSSSSRSASSRSGPRTSTSRSMRRSYVRNALAARGRGLRADRRGHRVPRRRHQQRCGLRRAGARSAERGVR